VAGAFRDAALFKLAYGYGLRRNEVRMLDMADFSPNVHAPEFGELGVCYVRHGGSWQPADRIPDFHLILAGGYFALGAIAVAVVWWLVRRTSLSAG
jgi:hypothetical protein